MIGTAPGKLIITGEYAVLDGAPAVVVAVNRRAIAKIDPGAARGSSPFLLAVANELVTRFGPDATTRTALEIVVDSGAFYDGPTKLGLGSSAAVTVAATALALSATGDPLDRDEVFDIASAAHATAQAPRGSPGSGADIAASVYGGAIVFTMRSSRSGAITPVVHQHWPASVMLLPFFTGHTADTPSLVARMAEARMARPAAVDAALAAITDASRAAVAAMTGPPDLTASALIAAIRLAGAAMDRLEAASLLELVPPNVAAARMAMARLGGTAKTTGAGGGDVAIAVLPAAADATKATRTLIDLGCLPLNLSVDETGVDLRPATS